MGFGAAAAALILLLAAPSPSGAQYFNSEYVSPAPRGGGNRELRLAGYSANYPSVQAAAALEDETVTEPFGQNVAFFLGKAHLTKYVVKDIQCCARKGLPQHDAQADRPTRLLGGVGD